MDNDTAVPQYGCHDAQPNAATLSTGRSFLADPESLHASSADHPPVSMTLTQEVCGARGTRSETPSPIHTVFGRRAPLKSLFLLASLVRQPRPEIQAGFLVRQSIMPVQKVSR